MLKDNKYFWGIIKTTAYVILSLMSIRLVIGVLQYAF